VSELDDLRSATRDLLEDKAPVRSNTEDNPGIWKQLAVERGLAALPVEAPLSWTATVAEETGRVLLRAPFVPTAVAAAVTKEPGLADGSLTAAVQTDDVVPWAATADLLLDLRGPDALLVRDFTATPVEALDLTRPAANVRHGGGESVGSSSDALDLLHVLTAAECVGAAQRILELVVEHLLVRTQFGRPLGSFQALRHKVADLTVLVEAARSSTWYAASEPDDFAVVAPLARALASEAFVTVTGESIQLFGGIGFTWEHDAHLYFKRAWTTALAADSKALKQQAFERSGA
jgi:alkylation response protein AidB-like acyl-CoA dehydrogenase